MTADYIDMLKQEFLDRKSRRSQYSERAFARDLDLSSGFISLLFNGKRSLSPRTSLKIVKNLNWSELKTKQFMESVHASQLVENKKEKVIKPAVEDYELELDHFRLVSNVQHFAVLEFIQSRKVASVEMIAEYLGLEKLECEMLLKRLLRLSLIVEDKKGYKTSPKNRKLGGTPSEAIRNYHKQAIKMAHEAVDAQDFSKRELRALTLSIDPKKMKQAKASIDRFIKDFNNKYGNKSGGEIYQLNVQMFSHKKMGEGQ